MQNRTCPACGNEMKLLRTETVADSEYSILLCTGCNKQLARREG